MGEDKYEIVPQRELIDHLKLRLQQGWFLRQIGICRVSDEKVPPQWLIPEDWSYRVRFVREISE